MLTSRPFGLNFDGTSRTPPRSDSAMAQCEVRELRGWLELPGGAR